MCAWQQWVCRIAHCLGFSLSLRSCWWCNHMFTSSKKVSILHTNVRWSAPWIVLIPLDTTRLQFTTWTELAKLSLASGFGQKWSRTKQWFSQLLFIAQKSTTYQNAQLNKSFPKLVFLLLYTQALPCKQQFCPWQIWVLGKDIFPNPSALPPKCNN